MKAPWSLVPMLFPLAAVVAGTFMQHCGVPLYFSLIIFVIAAAAAWLRRRVVSVMLLLTAAAFFSTSLRQPVGMPECYDGVSARHSGVVERIGEGITTMTVDLVVDSIDSHRVSPFRLHVNVPGYSLPATVYDRVAVRCKADSHPGYSDLPDEIDPQSVGGAVHAFVPVDSFQFIRREPGTVYALRRMRDRVVDRVHASPLDPATAVFVSAVLTGAADDLLVADRQRFADAGLSHILALSGLHVGIIAWIIGLALYPLFPMHHSRPRIIITILALWTFAVATGLSASVTRSVIMASAVLTGLMLRRRHSPFNSLFLAATIIIVADPEALFTAGFQLSFAAVAGILALTVPVSSMPREKSALRAVILAVGVPVAAVASTALISTFYFHTFPFHFLGANICICFLLPPMMVAAVITLLTNHHLPAALTDTSYSAITSVADFFGALPAPHISLYLSGECVAVGWVALAFLVLACVRRRASYLIMASMAAVTAIGLEWLSQPVGSLEPTAYFLRSRHSFDVAVPDGRILVITTTARPREYGDISEMARFRYSRYMGRRGIDSILVTDEFVTPEARRNGDTLYVGHRRYCLLGKDHVALPREWKGTVVASSRFRGDILRAVEGSGVDTVLLASDLHPRRAARYIRELTSAGIVAVDLRESPMRLR